MSLLDEARKALPGLEWDELQRGSLPAGVSAEVPFWTNIEIHPGHRYAFHLSFEGHRTVHHSLDALFAHLLPQVTARRDALNAALGEGWVPVGERLPDLRTHVLAWDGTQVFTALRLTEVWISFGPDRCGSVTHWMPLPAPPKEGGK